MTRDALLALYDRELATTRTLIERIPADKLSELQVNLVRSHVCGVGPRLPKREVRAMMLLRANVLAAGYSGARTALAAAHAT